MVWVYAHTFNDSVIRKYMINTNRSMSNWSQTFFQKKKKEEENNRTLEFKGKIL